MIDIAVRKHRLEICGECPRNENNICNVCFCFISSKTAEINGRCPLLKW